MRRFFFEKFGLLFWVNGTLFLALWLSFAVQPSESAASRYLFSAIALSVVFFLTSQNCAAVLERLSGETFTLYEKLATIAVISLIIPPVTLILLVEPSGSWLTYTPFLVAASSWVVATIAAPHFWERQKPDSIKPFLVPSLIIAALVFGIFVFQITTAYYALPDIDPYYWLQEFQQSFAHPVGISISDHRPLFLSLGYLFIQVAHTDGYAFLKYVIPALFLLTLLPALLVARHARTFLETASVFLMPIASSSFLLYSVSSLPQSIANTLLVSGLYLLLDSALSRKRWLALLGGSALLGATFYHEASLLFLVPWMLVAAYAHRHSIFAFVKSKWLAVFTLCLVILISYEALLSLFFFLVIWTKKVLFAVLQFQSNLAFPATYINIDGNPVGWSSASGVLRYYAFYLGPMALVALLWITRQLSQKNWLHWKSAWSVLHALERELLAYVFIVASLFFAISELLPRFFNLSLLPERALGFLSCILVFTAGYCAIRFGSMKPLYPSLLVGAAIISLGGALYINSVKQYLITSNQMSSAEWIRGALPKNRVIFSSTHINLLRFHSQTESVIGIDDPSFYTDIRIFNKALSHIPSLNDRYQDDYQLLIQHLEQQAETLQGLNSPQAHATVTRTLSELETHISSFAQNYPDNLALESPLPEGGLPVFVYYAKENKRNPYADRPYATNRQDTAHSGLVFDKYPDRFERVYALPGDEVVVWKLIQ